MSDRMPSTARRKFTTGKYAEGFGPGGGGIFYVEETVVRIVGFARDHCEAIRIANAMVALAKANGDNVDPDC